ncbi:MAG: riboflavin synthase [Sediminibacterium sp.]|jgi:riboflavin synthase|nr:riboflavin synthase [Sediminibacterium sp.]
MFTGIVSDGFIASILPDAEGWELVIDAPKFGSIVQLGDSVAIDGACLTVFKIDGDHLSFFVSTESIDKTIIKNYKVGTKINMELPMQPNGYLGGHYVLGHVDTTAKVKMVQPGEKAWFFTIAIPSQFVKYVVYKGSVAINGISLTINKVIDDDIELCIIPVTIEKTNMSLLNVNDSVNIEFDILAKYTEQLLNKRAVKDV